MNFRLTRPPLAGGRLQAIISSPSETELAAGTVGSVPRSSELKEPRSWARIRRGGSGNGGWCGGGTRLGVWRRRPHNRPRPRRPRRRRSNRRPNLKPTRAARLSSGKRRQPALGGEPAVDWGGTGGCRMSAKRLGENRLWPEQPSWQTGTTPDFCLPFFSTPPISAPPGRAWCRPRDNAAKSRSAILAPPALAGRLAFPAPLDFPAAP